MMHEEVDGRDKLQLLPGTKKRLRIKVPGENHFLYIGSVIFGAALVIVFSLGRYENSLRSQVEQLNDQLVSLEQKRNKNDEMELRSTKDRLNLTSELIKGHTYWTQGLLWLENILQRDVQVRSITASRDGKLIFSGIATNYSILAKQIAAFLADDRVTSLVVGKISTTASGFIEYNLNITLDLPRLILKK